MYKSYIFSAILLTLYALTDSYTYLYLAPIWVVMPGLVYLIFAPLVACYVSLTGAHVAVWIGQVVALWMAHTWIAHEAIRTGVVIATLVGTGQLTNSHLSLRNLVRSDPSRPKTPFLEVFQWLHELVNEW